MTSVNRLVFIWKQALVENQY